MIGREQPNKVWKLRCRDRAGLLWSETKGTVWFDGPQSQKDVLSTKAEAVLADGVVAAPAPTGSTIFVVHGSDHDARDRQMPGAWCEPDQESRMVLKIVTGG